MGNFYTTFKDLRKHEDKIFINFSNIYKIFLWITRQTSSSSNASISTINKLTFIVATFCAHRKMDCAICASLHVWTALYYAIHYWARKYPIMELWTVRDLHGHGTIMVTRETFHKLSYINKQSRNHIHRNSM